MSSGSVAESGIFELAQPSLMQYQLAGAVQCEPGASVVAVLFDQARGQELGVCGARVGTGPARRFVVRAASSLHLEPGLYRWQSRLLPRAGTALLSPRLSGVWAQNPQLLETLGTTEAYSMIGGPAGQEWLARGLVTVRAEGELVTAQLVVTDLATNQPTGPPAEFGLLSPMEDKDVGFVPYALQPGRRYVARLTVQCNAEVSCRLVQERKP